MSSSRSDYLATLNHSDFSITFASKCVLDWFSVLFASTATAGNRQVELRVKDAAGNVLYAVAAGAVQAASLTNRYLFVPGVTRESAFVSKGITAPLPKQLVIPSGGTVEAIDTAAIDALADDLTFSWGVTDM